MTVCGFVAFDAGDLLSLAFFAAFYSPTVMFDSAPERCALTMVISRSVDMLVHF